MSDTGTDSSTSTFISALWFNAALTVGFFSVFVMLRTTRLQTFAPRTYAVPKENRPPPLPSGFGQWLINIFRIKDEAIIKSIGLDRFMVLKFLRMGIVTFFLYSIVAIPILFPLNIINQGSLEGLNRFTMGNVTQDSRTWAHCLLAVILSVLVWYYTFHETNVYIELRRKFLLSSDYADTVAARTLYVPSIPKSINNTDDLAKVFNKFPGGVRRIWLNRQLDDLPDLVKDRQKAALSLEAKMTKAILATYKYNMKKDGNRIVEEEGSTDALIPENLRPTHRESSLPIPLPCFGHKVDSINFYHSKIKELNTAIVEKQEKVNDFCQVNSAFIEFNNQIAAHMAAQTLMDKRSMQMAPRYINIAPSDIIWGNMNIRSFERMIRKFISISITTAIIVFWVVPVVFVQAIANLKTLSTVLPFLAGINNLGPTVVGIIQGILPAVALSILISLVPIIFTILSTMEGIPQKSFVSLSVLHKFFFFQLIDVVLVSTLAGGFATVISQFSSLVQNPLGVINTLSTELPKASTFFITFVMLQSTNQSGMAILQLVPYILSYVMPLFATTPRDIYKQKLSCPDVDLGTLIPSHSIIFVLGLEYGVISPLILPFVLLFFMFQYFVYLYQFLYVYEIPYETAGRAFPRAIRHVYIGLIISQLTLIGLFGIRSGGKGQMALMIVTLVLTCFALYYYDCAFKPLFKYLPVSSFEDVTFNHNDSLIANGNQVYNIPEDEKKDPKAEHISDGSTNLQEDKINQKEVVNQIGASNPAPRVKPIFTKVATNSSDNSPTSVEAYCARKELLGRLEEEKVKESESTSKDSEKITATAKSLYAAESYMHPSAYAPKPTIWIPEDRFGISQNEIKEAKSFGIDASSKWATVLINEKGKARVTIDEESLINDYQVAPGAGLSAANQSNVNNYVRVLVEGYNLGDAIN